MTEFITDERLEVILESVGDHLVIPERSTAVRTGPEPNIVSIETAAPRKHSGRTRRLAVAAAVIAVLVISATISPVRSAMADVIDFLTFGSVRIEQTDSDDADPAGLPSLAEGAATVSEDEAADQFGHPLPGTEGLGLGPPDDIAVTPDNGVLLIWEEEGTTLWITPSTDPPEIRTRKLVDELDAVEEVPDLGESAVSITGDHVLSTPARRVAAQSVVLWISAGHEYRLESDRPVEDLVAGARSIITPE